MPLDDTLAVQRLMAEVTVATRPLNSSSVIPAKAGIRAQIPAFAE